MPRPRLPTLPTLFALLGAAVSGGACGPDTVPLPTQVPAPVGTAPVVAPAAVEHAPVEDFRAHAPPADQLDKPVLALAERERLAEIEHHVLKLGQRAFPALAGHLVARNAADFLAALTPDARAEVLTPTPLRDVKGRLFRTRRAVRADGVRAVDGAGLFAVLTELRDTFDDTPSIGFRARNCAPVDDAAPLGAWLCRCRLQMSGRSADGGIRETSLELELDLTRMPDVDEIATATAWISGVRVLELLEVASDAPLMAEVGAERGVSSERLHDNWDVADGGQLYAMCGGMYVADVDADGWNDVLVLDVSGPRLFRALGDGTFEDFTEASRLPATLPPAGAVAFADFDGDGLVDLVNSRQMFRNVGAGRFEDITLKAGLPLQVGSGITVADFDLDGRIDIYVATSHGVRGALTKTSWFGGEGGPGNKLWLNRGNWRFEEVAERIGAGAGRRSSFTSAALHANDDMRPDLYVIDEFGPGVLLLNQPDGTFTSAPLEERDGDYGSMGLAVGDHDNDGRVDVYTANMFSKAGRRIINNLASDAYAAPVVDRLKKMVTGSELYLNAGPAEDGRLTWTRCGDTYGIKDVGWPYGAAFVDLDSDGFLDLYATAGFVSVDPTVPDG